MKNPLDALADELERLANEIDKLVPELDTSIRDLSKMVEELTRKEDRADKLQADMARAEIDQKNRSYAAFAGMNAGMTVVRFE